MQAESELASSGQPDLAELAVKTMQLMSIPFCHRDPPSRSNAAGEVAT